MLYFAYGSNMSTRAVAEWCRAYKMRAPLLVASRAAVLDNYRLCFPIYNEYWGGGIADIVYDPGKYVAGVIFEVSDADMAILDQKVARVVSPSGDEVGAYRRVDVSVAPLAKGPAIKVVTYQGMNSDRFQIAPTRHYMDVLIQGACEFKLSTMWISYLQSFTTQAGRKPARPPQQ
jgi:hypothetical protein